MTDKTETFIDKQARFKVRLETLYMKYFVINQNPGSYVGSLSGVEFREAKNRLREILDDMELEIARIGEDDD